MVRSQPRVDILSMAIPTIVGNLLFSMVGFASIKIVGILGTSAVAAALGGERLLLFTQCVFLLVTGGTTALVAQSWGAKDRASTVHYMRVSLLMMLAVSTLLSLALVTFAPQFVTLLGLHGEARALTIRFLVVSGYFNVPVGLALAVAAGLRAMGDAYTPLWTFATANVVNIALAYVFVYGKLGIAPLGIAGAALASGLSFTLAAALLTTMWFAREPNDGMPARKPIFDWSAARRLSDIGLPAAVEQGFFHAGLMAMMFIVAQFDQSAFAAYGVGLILMSFSYVFGFGFAIASATVVGQHIGAGDPVAARAAAWRSAGYCACCMTALGTVVLLLSDEIRRFLGLAPEVAADLRQFLVILAIVQPFLATEFALAGALRGAGETRTVMYITLSGLTTRLIVAAAVYSAGLGIGWVFATLLLDYGLKASLYAIRISSPAWSVRRATI